MSLGNSPSKTLIYFYLENSGLTLALRHYTNCKLGTTLRIVLCQSARYCILALTDKTEYENENKKLVSDDLKTAVLASTKRIKSKIVQKNMASAVTTLKKSHNREKYPPKNLEYSGYFLKDFLKGIG